MTPNEYLQLPDEALAIKLGEVLEPEKNRGIDGDCCADCHNYYPTGDDCPHTNWLKEHLKCERFKPKRCPVSLTNWNEAMKHRDRAVDKWGDRTFHDALCCVYWDYFNLNHNFKSVSMKKWTTCYTQPKHIYIACALLEERNDK